MQEAKLFAAATVIATMMICGLATMARAHEVLHSIERGRAIAVKAHFADGEVLAYTEYQVFSPSDPKIPYQKGRTDRSGYLAFVPDRVGSWQVKITDSSGHGLDLDIVVDTLGPSPGTAEAQPAATPASWAFVARPIVGVAVIAGLFVGLILVYRRKGVRP
jgi:nickel transport protein